MFDNLLDKELKKQMKLYSMFVSIVIRNAMDDFSSVYLSDEHSHFDCWELREKVGQ